MKKLVLVAAAFLVIAGMTSCKKDYTCTCSVNGTVVGTVTIHDTKSKATTACNSTASAAGITETCSLN